MRSFLPIILLSLTISVVGQPHSFTKDFIPATITLNDSTIKTGFLKWSTNQNDKLRFKTGEKKETIKYSPSEILGFEVDSVRYKSLFNVEVCAENYPLLGKTSLMKQGFGQILHEGKVNMYFVIFDGYEPMEGAGEFSNIVFEKINGDKKEYASYPVLVRMTEEKYEKAKQNLYVFFADSPAIVEKIKQYKPQQDFFAIGNLIKETF